MKVGHRDVRCSTVEPEAMALELLSQHHVGWEDRCHVFIFNLLHGQKMSKTVHPLKRSSSLWMYYFFLQWRMVYFFFLRLCYCGLWEHKTKEHFQMSLREWVSLTSLTCLSLCFPLCPSLSHLVLWVRTPRVSGALLLVCLCTYSSFKAYCQLPNPSLCLSVFACVSSILSPCFLPAVAPLRPGPGTATRVMANACDSALPHQTPVRAT